MSGCAGACAHLFQIQAEEHGLLAWLLGQLAGTFWALVWALALGSANAVLFFWLVSVVLYANLYRWLPRGRAWVNGQPLHGPGTRDLIRDRHCDLE